LKCFRPYDKLTGQEQKILKERKARAIAAQEIREIVNKGKINTDTPEEMTLIKNRSKKIFV